MKLLTGDLTASSFDLRRLFPDGCATSASSKSTATFGECGGERSADDVDFFRCFAGFASPPAFEFSRFLAVFYKVN